MAGKSKRLNPYEYNRGKRQRRRVMQATRNTVIVISLAAWILLAFAPGPKADPPMELYYFVQWAPLKEAARGFPAGDVRAFETAFNASVIKDPDEVHRFGRSNNTFTPVEAYRLFDALAELIKRAISRGEVAAVERFIEAVSDNHWITGEQISARGGSFYVVLTPPVSEKDQYQLHIQNRLTAAKEYIGTSTSRSLGLSASTHPPPWLTEISMPANPAELSITLERFMCYGTCPIYSLTIVGTGRSSTRERNS
jgi:hypothetical protein